MLNPLQNISNVERAEGLYNILKIQNAIGLQLPEWTKEVFPEELLTMAKRNLAVLTENTYMKRIKGGSFVTEVVDTMHKKREASLFPDRNIYIYSGHDVTLVNIMRAMEIIEQTSEKPDFGAALTFELHRQNEMKDYEVKVCMNNLINLFPRKLHFKIFCLFHRFGIISIVRTIHRKKFKFQIVTNRVCLINLMHLWKILLYEIILNHVNTLNKMCIF